MGSMGRGALENVRSRTILEQSLRNALAGGNVSNYATDNASGDFARGELAHRQVQFPVVPHRRVFFEPRQRRAWLALEL